MKVLIFNGTLNKANDTSQEIANYLKEYLLQLGATSVIFNLSEYDIPFFEEDFSEVPDSVTKMLQVFKEYDRHIWLSPLYHGGMVGAMKNCLDWLILSSKDENPYLTHKIIAIKKRRLLILIEKASGINSLYQALFCPTLPRAASAIGRIKEIENVASKASNVIINNKKLNLKRNSRQFFQI